MSLCKSAEFGRNICRPLDLALHIMFLFKKAALNTTAHDNTELIHFLSIFTTNPQIQLQHTFTPEISLLYIYNIQQNDS